MTRTNREKRRSKGGGYLYVTTNPAWHGYVKIGRTTNILSRMRTYQTGSPFRDYELFYYRYFNNVRLAERHLAQTYQGAKFFGEWYQIHPQDASNLIDLTFLQLKEK